MTLIHGNAETVPYPDGSLDFAVSEDGAATWCDPYVWIPEAHRLLRPGGTLVFLRTSTLATLCSPVDGSVPTTERARARLIHDPPPRLRATPSTSRAGSKFNLPLSRWFRLFREMGFDVLDFLEWWSLYLVDRRRHHRAMRDRSPSRQRGCTRDASGGATAG